MKRIIASIIIVTLLVSVFSVVYASAETNSDASLAESHEANEILKGDYWYLPVSETTAGIVEYIGNEDKVNIPSEIDGYKIIGIGHGAFTCCGTIKEVVIPDGVTSIGEYAFRACNNLSVVHLPNTLISIGRAAFRSDSLTSITIPDSVDKIERGAFAGNKNLADVKIGTGIQTIGKSAFNQSDILTISGYVNTVAYDFAYSNGIKFKSLGNAPEPATTEPVVINPQPTENKPTTPAVVKPTVKKKANPIKVTVKTRTVKLKKLKKKDQKVKAIIVKNAQDRVTYKLVAKGITKKIRKLVKITSKGVILLNKWKNAKKGTYNIRVRITAEGNTKFKKKVVIKTVKIKIK